MSRVQIRSSLILLLAAVIWGLGFVAQSVGMDAIGPFTFNCARSFIAGFALIPCIFLLKRQKGEPVDAGKTREQKEEERRNLILGGVLCGIFLTGATNFQQIGILYTSIGKAGFLTSIYIIIVPILGILFKRRCGFSVWIGVLLALIGLYFLCFTDSAFAGGALIEKGDFYLFLCALMFSLQIMCVDYFSRKADGVRLSCLQFFVCGVLTIFPMLLAEQPSTQGIVAAWKPLLYAGVLSSGVGYTLQMVGQKGVNPTVASLIMSLESVVSVLAGFLILGQKLSPRELLGCGFMFCAIIFAQLPDKKGGKNNERSEEIEI